MMYYSNVKWTANGSWESDDGWHRSSHWAGKKGRFIPWISLFFLSFQIQTTGDFIICYSILFVLEANVVAIHIMLALLFIVVIIAVS